MMEWDYVEKLKTFSNDQLYREYTKIQSQLDETTKPYTQRSRRKQEGAIDDNYHPQDSPARESHNFSQPTGHSKKRKKPAVGKSMKRKRANYPSTGDVADPPLAGNKRQKKRKREDGSEGPRKFPRNATASRRKNTPFDDSDEDLGSHSLKRRKFEERKFEESDEEMSETSDFGRRLIPEPQNEYSDLPLQSVVDKLVGYSKKLEKLKLQKLFETQLTELHNKNITLENSKEGIEDAVQDLNNEKHRLELEVKMQTTKIQAREEQVKKFKKKNEEINKMYNELSIKFREHNTGAGFGLDADTIGIEKENRTLKATVALLNIELEKHKSNSKNGKVHVSPDELWVEKKFSKELQQHYKSLVEIVQRKSDGDAKMQEHVQNARQQMEQIMKLRNQLSEKDDVIAQKTKEIERLTNDLLTEQSTPVGMKNSGKKKSTKKIPPVKKESSTTTRPITTRPTTGKKKDFNESDLKQCVVCCSKTGDLFQINNPHYISNMPTTWFFKEEAELWSLINQPYSLFHKRCTRGAAHLKEIPHGCVQYSWK